MSVLVFDNDQKQRLDTFLADNFTAISRSFLQKLCSTDQILVNGSPEKSGYRLRHGDKVKILYDMGSIDKIDHIELPVLYEDDDVIVINKPAGVISHARGRYWNEPSVASFVREKTGQDGERAGIVHRLDRATSGVMICAKTTDAMKFLQKQFADRKVHKTYLAVVRGHLDPQQAIIDMPIERNPKAPSTFRVGPNGKPAQTEYKVTKSTADYDMVELYPRTGRTHQLRVHMKHQGHLIVGDELYGDKPAERLFLHAHSIELKLPNGEKTMFSAPIPSDFALLTLSDK